MLFPTIVFALFFLLVYAGHRALLDHPACWKAFILAASYVFYGYWDWRFIGLIAASSVFNHACALLMDRRASTRWRRLILILSIGFNLGTLGFFKYYGFFVLQIYAACARLGISCSLPLLDIILPVGISFFTFQAMSYVIDIYRGELRPTKSLLDFAVYLAFFPQLVAGPIVRARVFLPQLEQIRHVAVIDVGRAAVLILIGLFKKIVVANYLAEQIVDPVFSNPSAYGALDTLVGVYGYAIQIYCDFSAYSDIAIGIALLLGFHFPLNFNAPYFATSIQEFWRRWHISLSTWLRDYLYIPLGGSRHSSARTYRNLFLTFLLGGLWHGAAWTFVAWGVLHGAYLMIERVADHLRGINRKVGTKEFAPLRVLKMIWVFHLVCLSWLFFRSETFADAATMIARLAHWDAPVLVSGPILLVIVVGVLTQLFDGARFRRLWDRYTAWHPVWQGAAAALALTVILTLGPKGVAPFIYFQF